MTDYCLQPATKKEYNKWCFNIYILNSLSDQYYLNGILYKINKSITQFHIYNCKFRLHITYTYYIRMCTVISHEISIYIYKIHKRAKDIWEKRGPLFSTDGFLCKGMYRREYNITYWWTRTLSAECCCFSQCSKVGYTCSWCRSSVYVYREETSSIMYRVKQNKKIYLEGCRGVYLGRHRKEQQQRVLLLLLYYIG